jgi:hypothetical protein
MTVSGAAVAVLAVLGIVLLTQRSPSAPPVGTQSSSLAGHTSSPASASTQTTPATQATGVTIPAAFAGTWQGTATMSAIGTSGVSLTNSITFTLTAGARTAHEVNQDCVNTLTLSQVTATVLTFSEPQTVACVAGTVTFTRHGANLAYRWTDNIEQNVATLHKG